MEFEMKDEWGTAVEQLSAAAGLLQAAVERLAERESNFARQAEATLERLAASAESRREAELEQRLAAAEAQLAAAEATIAEMRASAATATEGFGRKTLPPAAATLLAKQGINVESIEAGAVDAALSSLSMEQRIAVKSQLMRAGLLG